MVREVGYGQGGRPWSGRHAMVREVGHGKGGMLRSGR